MKKLVAALMERIFSVMRALASGRYSGEALAAPGGFPQQILLDAFNYFLSKVVPGLMGFLSVVVFVRLVGYEQYGRYAVVLAFVMASASGMAGWLSQGILRFQSRWHEPAAAEVFLHSAEAGTKVSVAVGGLALGIAIPSIGMQKGWSLLISLSLFGVLLVYSVTLARFQASLQSASVLRFEAARSIGAFVIPVLLIWITGLRDYRFLLLGIALGYFLPLFGPIRFQAKSDATRTPNWRLRLSKAECKVLGDLWGFGWPVALWILCQQLLFVSDRFLIQRFSGFSDAGVYASMYDVVVRSFSLILMPVTLAVHPFVMNRWNAGGRRGAVIAIRAGLKYQVLAFAPIGVLLAIFAPWVSRLVLGHANPRAAAIVLPLALGGFLWQVCLLAHKPLEILFQTKRMLAAIVVALATSVAGNWLLVPGYGYRASAYLTVASPVAYLMLLLALTPMKELRKAIDADQTVVRTEGQPLSAERFLTTP